MEVTCLAVGVVGLAGLFSVCLDSLSRFQSYRESNSETHVLDTRFRAARARFEQWGVSVGISNGRLQPDHHDGLDNKETVDLIESIIQIITKTICDESILQRARTGPRFQSGQFGGLSQSRGKRLKWALGGKEIRNEQVDIFEKLVQQLYNLIPPEDKSQDYEGLESTAWVKDIRRMLNKIEEGIKSETQRDVLSWLGKSPPSDRYEDSLSKRLDTTCEWIFDRSKFKSWLSLENPSRPGLLWINGPAGFGKTVLCAHIVQHLFEVLATPVAHFFFTADHESREDPFSALRSWECQVAAKNSDAFECIRRAWENDISEKASRGSLVKLFNEIVTAVPGCVFIADGLDECSQLGTGDASVAWLLRDITNAIAGTDVRLLLVSRDEPEIREVLGNQQDKFSEYRIGTVDVEADTAAFSQSVVDKRLSNKSVDLRSAISKAMTVRCQGQFLWIKMQGESLRNGMSRKRLYEVVEDTPSSLDRIYDHNWTRITEMPDRDRDRAFALLRWTAFTLIPLTVYAATEAVLITQFGELDPDEYPESFDDIYIKTEIVGLCGPLLEVRDDAENLSPRYRTLHIPHFSVHQYIVEHLPVPAWMQANRILNGEHERVHHTAIARACVQYLSLPQVWEKDGFPYLCTRALLFYAAYFWLDHARISFMDNSLFVLSEAFLSNDSFQFKSFVNYLVEHQKVVSLKVEILKPGLRPLEYMFYEGWTKMADRLISDADVNEIGALGRSPIFSACYSGSADSVKTLIQQGADLSITDSEGLTCLHVAVRGGHENIIGILVESKVKLSPQDHGGRTPLHFAAGWGHIKCYQVLLKQGADITIKDIWGGNVVHHACLYAGQAETLRFILQNAPANFATDHYGTLGSPLILVSEVGDADMANILFEHGAASSLFDPSHDGELPLRLAASSGHIELVKLFLEHGAERTLIIPDRAGNTTLHLVCRVTGLEGIISLLLLQPGIEESILMENEDGNTPVHVASEAGCALYVKLILQYSEPGCQHLLKKRNKKLETPLYLASSSGHVNVVRELLNFGAQATLSVSDGMDQTPLFIASYNGHAEVVNALLEHGADPNIYALDSYNSSPLWAASIKGSRDIVKELLSHGAGRTITASGKGGETPLHAAATENQVEVLKLLLEVPGISINQKTTYGFTALFIAARNGYHDIVKLLLATDSVDIDSENWLGLTPLFAAVANGHFEVTELLLWEGVDVQSEVSIGRDLLWWAQRSSNKGLIQLFQSLEDLIGTPSESYNPLPGPFLSLEPLSHDAETIACEPGMYWCYVCTLSVRDDQDFHCVECSDSYMFLCSECFTRGFQQCPRSHIMVPYESDESDNSSSADRSVDSDD
ncbi:related to ankyrin [Fusarium oxysporum]|uniref:Related to ankyrin n=1 Tax=Fusarium oxysporum TaxID=5507 RepID=A0A2H3T6C8_FUSOX|nr:related to ankyrin [Fusarium oxysporum]